MAFVGEFSGQAIHSINHRNLVPEKANSFRTFLSEASIEHMYAKILARLTRCGERLQVLRSEKGDPLMARSLESPHLV
jgi:hypothetical protein